MEIKAVIIGDKEFRVGEEASRGGSIIHEILEYEGGINDPRNGYNFLGVYGIDVKGNLLFSAMTGGHLILLFD